MSKSRGSGPLRLPGGAHGGNQFLLALSTQFGDIRQMALAYSKRSSACGLHGRQACLNYKRFFYFLSRIFTFLTFFLFLFERFLHLVVVLMTSDATNERVATVV